MLGRHHLSLSVGSVAPMLAPIFPIEPIMVIVAITGTAIGSLIPDADAQDAAIFHGEVKGIEGGNAEILNAIGFLYPVFGYATKYLIYKPAVIFYDALVFDDHSIKERHRGILHSFLGLGTATVITGIFMFPILLYLGLFSLVGIAIFLVTYFVGAVLHLAEDSCTKTGIQWNYPFQSWEIKGQITTTARPEDTKYQNQFLMVLGGVTGALFILPLVVEQIPNFAFSVLGLLIVVVLWFGFGRFVAKCEIHQ